MFKKNKFSRWVEYSQSRDGGTYWGGTERRELIYPIFGTPFPNDYPFKLFYIQDDAPVIENDSQVYQPTNLTVNIQMAIQRAFIFDLSRIKKGRNEPLLVTKRLDGNYCLVTDEDKFLLTEEELGSIKVPIKMGGDSMKFISQGGLEQALKLNIKTIFDENGSTTPDTFPYNSGMILLIVSIEGAEDPENYSKITSAEIMSYEQVKILGEDYLEGKKVFTIFDASLAGQYESNSIFNQSVSKGFLPEQTSKIFKEEQSREDSFIHTFVLRARLGSNSSPSYYDHLFLRL